MTTILAYLLVVAFFILEGRLRRGDQASSLKGTEADRGSTARLGLAYGLSSTFALAAPLLNALHIGQITWHPTLLSWGGVALIASSLGLRLWAFRVLGASYTRTLQIDPRQRVIQEGPYRLIRHPGYLGGLLQWFGAGFAVQNWIVWIAILVVVIYAYLYRIRCEETMLSQAFGEEFETYRRNTWKLILFLY